MATHLFGIRHHGPGSSKNLLRALADIKPDIILVEGPPEGEKILQWIAHQDMKPPVALLAFVPENPQQAVFYPFAEYSPEWNAIKYALAHAIPVRFMDMPLVHKLAKKTNDAEQENEMETDEPLISENRLAHLAAIAGFEEADEWWEHQFELHQHATSSFDAIAEAMSSLREAYPLETKNDLLREAFMRQAIRTAQSENYEHIAVVCGAWHVPALQTMPTKKADSELLKNLPKTPVETTWIPWTNDRLMFESGYGAGVTSPGWYQHVWNYPDDNGTRWLTLTAQVLRQNKIDVSSAHVIEATRLTQALASLRNLTAPGLKELTEATQSVMCMGDDAQLKLVNKNLIIGTQLGQIPENAPFPPIYHDFEKKAKSLRLKVTNEVNMISLDLREAFDLQKSIFLHRLSALNIAWGSQQSVKGKGTFKEEWRLYWQPEFTIQLLEKASWGNTIEAAANQYLVHEAQANNSLLAISMLVQKALPTELHEGIKAAIKRLDELAASTSDAIALADAFFPLVQIYRYGNVRNTNVEIIDIILQSIFYRIIAGLPFSTSNVNEDTAAEVAQKIRQLHDGIIRLENDEYKREWLRTVTIITNKTDTEGIINGTCYKILYDQKMQSTSDIAMLLSRIISLTNESSYVVQWLEGFLAEGITVLLFDEELLSIIDAWLDDLQEEYFLQLVPLLRRTFSPASNAERRKLAQSIVRGSAGAAKKVSTNARFDNERAERVIPIFETLISLNRTEANGNG